MNRLKAVIFDMDGTITKPFLNFKLIREEIGVVGEPLLERMAELHGEERKRAWRILERHEEEAAANAELNDDARELLVFLVKAGVKTALFTRNSRKSVDKVLLSLGLVFDAIATRDDAPPKPKPDAIFLLCRRLGVEPPETLVVGDYLYDIVAGKESGAATALVTNGVPPAFEHNADHTVAGLQELRDIVQSLLGCSHGDI